MTRSVPVWMVAAVVVWVACVGAAVAAFPTDWTYSDLITIQENSGSDLADYQILVELDTSNFDFTKAQSDGADVRFTKLDGILLSHWTESWDSTGESAKVWVKIPSIPGSGTTTIYMYYGNAGVGSESDGDTVFEFFDDFEGTSLDTNKWDDSDSKGSYSITVADSVIALEPLAGDGYTILDSKTPFDVNTALRFRSKYGDMGYDDWAGIGYHKDWWNFIEVHEDGDVFNGECFISHLSVMHRHITQKVSRWHDVLHSQQSSVIQFYAAP